MVANIADLATGIIIGLAVGALLALFVSSVKARRFASELGQSRADLRVALAHSSQLKDCHAELLAVMEADFARLLEERENGLRALLADKEVALTTLQKLG